MNLFDDIAAFFATTGESTLESSINRLLELPLLSFGDEWYHQLYTTNLALALVCSLVVLIMKSSMALGKDKPIVSLALAFKEFGITFMIGYTLSFMVQMLMYVLNEAARAIAALPKLFFPDLGDDNGWFTAIVVFRNLLDPQGLLLLNTAGGIGGMLLEGQVILLQYSSLPIVALCVFAYVFRDVPLGETTFRVLKAALFVVMTTKLFIIIWLVANRIAMIGSNAMGRDAFIWVMMVSFSGSLIGIGIFLAALFENRRRKKTLVKGKVDAKLEKSDDSSGTKSSSSAATINNVTNDVRVDAPATYNVTNHVNLDKLTNASDIAAKNARLVALVATGTGTAASLAAKFAPHPGVKAASIAVTGAATLVAAKANMVAAAANKTYEATRIVGDAHDTYVQYREKKGEAK